MGEPRPKMKWDHLILYLQHKTSLKTSHWFGIASHIKEKWEFTVKFSNFHVMHLDWRKEDEFKEHGFKLSFTWRYIFVIYCHWR